MKAKSLAEEILPEETCNSREKIPNEEILVAPKLMHFLLSAKEKFCRGLKRKCKQIFVVYMHDPALKFSGQTRSHYTEVACRGEWRIRGAFA